MSGVASEAIKKGFEKMVESASGNASVRITSSTTLTEEEKQGVEGLLCESMVYTAKLIVERKVGPAEAGVHLITNLINLGKLTKQQQDYCLALKAEITLNASQLALTAFSAYVAAVAGGNAGIVAGVITGTVVGGPAGTVAGAAAGGIVGAGGPLLLGSYEMFEKAATITDLAIKHHSQCGPLVMDKTLTLRAAP